MTFASMTGFAESAGSHEGLRWRWEAKSVNSRSLDMRLRIPPGYDGLEPPARRLASERFLRGALQISLTVEPAESARGLTVDAAALASAVRIAREVAAETGLAPARALPEWRASAAVPGPNIAAHMPRWRWRDPAADQRLAPTI